MIKTAGQLSLQKIQNIFHSGENASGSISLYCWHSMIGKNMTLLQSKNFFYKTLLQPCDVCILWIFDLLHAIASSESFLEVESWTCQGKCIIGQSFAGKLLLHSNAPTRSLKTLHLKMLWGRLFCAGRLFLGRKEEDLYCKKNWKPLMFIVHICSWRL